MKTISIQSITEAGHDTDNALHILALCEHLDCEPSDLSRESYDHHGLALYSGPGGEYAIGTDDEATKAAEQNIEDSIWAFKAEFICARCNLPSEMEEAISAWQEKECESCNDALKEMVESHCSGGLHGSHSFSEAAISSDGRGHFLSPYDGEENEMCLTCPVHGLEYEDKRDWYDLTSGADSVTLYIYRTN